MAAAVPKPIYEHLVDLKEDGSFWLDMDYFNYCQGLTMTAGRFDDLFGGPPATPAETLPSSGIWILRRVFRP